jgi:hypothetical protein
VLRKIFGNGVLRKIFGNGVLRKIFGPKAEEVTNSWRKCRMMIFIFVPLARLLFE